MSEWICPKCGFDIKSSRKKHFKSCNGKGPRRKQEHPYAGKGTAWNKGLTKKNNEIVKIASENLKERYRNGELKPSFKGKEHTKETKEKISKSRTKFLEENPDKVPYILNHYSNGPSYPEIYFIDLIKKEEINLSYHKQIGIYELDFFNEEKKIDLEIDGDQHILDERIAKSDIKRTKYLEELGWTVVRVLWSDWKKKNLKEKKDFIDYIKGLLV